MNQTPTLTPEAHILMGKAAVETVTKPREKSPKRTIPGLVGPRGRSSSLCPPGRERTPRGEGGDKGQTESRDQHEERLRGGKAAAVSGAGWARAARAGVKVPEDRCCKGGTQWQWTPPEAENATPRSLEFILQVSGRWRECWVEQGHFFLKDFFCF